MDVMMPIAIHRPSKEEVYIDDVPSGLACDCVCMACNMPVVARKGEANTHHFAHHAKTSSDDIQCPFNSDRALYWMCRNILTESKTIRLPALQWQWREPDTGKYQTFDITTEKDIPIDHVAFPFTLEQGYDADTVILTIGSHKLALRLGINKQFTQSRPDLAENPVKIEEVAYAAVGIHVGNIPQMIKERRKGFRNIVREVVLESVENKVWIYHPKERKPRKLIADKQEAHRLLLQQRQEMHADRNKASQRTTRHTTPQSALSNRQGDRDPYAYLDPVAINNRLQLLIEEANKQRDNGKGYGMYCNDCCFMNSPEDSKCAFCDSTHLDPVDLSGRYFLNLEVRYRIKGYPQKSLIRVPG